MGFVASTHPTKLAQRFGVALDHFDRAFESLDLAAISDLSEAAFEMDSLAAFEARLAEIRGRGGGRADRTG